jgi:predicted nucleic acid-binding protein
LLIETDVLLASIIPDHPHRAPALKALIIDNLKLSPYTPFELNLLIRAGKLKVRSLQSFTRNLERLLNSREITILPDRLQYHAKAQKNEKRYQLTFFDSLHSAAAIVEDQDLCSFDRAYDRLKEEGLRRIDPRTL